VKGVLARSLSVRKLGTALLLVLAALPQPVRAGTGPGQFVVRCPYSHTNMDDPIVFPGQPGASHMHDFFGNTTVDASSTVASMLAGETTCRAASDTAGYWTPTPFLDGKQLRPPVMRIYYLGDGTPQVETIPAGLQIIGGNKLAQSPEENPHVRWYCGQRNDVKTPIMPAPYDCREWRSYPFVDGVIAIIDLPSCWDGAGLTPDHVAYREGGACPAGFPHVLPRLSERLHLGIMNPTASDGSVALTLSSGPYWTMHADFWNTWQQERLDQLVEQCLDAVVHCGSIDALVQPDWTSQFGTSRYDLAYAAAPDAHGAVVAGFTNLRLPGERYFHRSDAFVRALTRDGVERWTRQFGSSGVDQALAVTVAPDDSGAIYVAGYTEGRFPNQRRAGRSDVFVAKLSAGGLLRWVRQFGTRADEQATSVAVGSDGVMVGGWTDGPLQRGARHGGTDGFVARVGFDGVLRWVRQFGGHRDDAVRGLTSKAGRTIAVGWTSGGLRGPSEGGADEFVRAVGASGRALWTRQFGTSGDDVLTSVATLGAELYTAGSTTGTFRTQTSAGETDVVVHRLDQQGFPVWTTQFGSTEVDEATALNASEDGVFVSGSTTGALGTEGLIGETDAFAARFLRSGAVVWTEQLGTTDYDRAYGAAVDASGLYVVGTTHGAFEGHTNEGDRDAFVARLRFT
jgi:hypothetical protein